MLPPELLSKPLADSFFFSFQPNDFHVESLMQCSHVHSYFWQLDITFFNASSNSFSFRISPASNNFRKVFPTSSGYNNNFACKRKFFTCCNVPRQLILYPKRAFCRPNAIPNALFDLLHIQNITYFYWNTHNFIAINLSRCV